MKKASAGRTQMSPGLSTLVRSEVPFSNSIITRNYTPSLTMGLFTIVLLTRFSRSRQDAEGRFPIMLVTKVIGPNGREPTHVCISPRRLDSTIPRCFFKPHLQDHLVPTLTTSNRSEIWP
jgi:hypothetical protein